MIFFNFRKSEITITEQTEHIINKPSGVVIHLAMLHFSQKIKTSSVDNNIKLKVCHSIFFYSKFQMVKGALSAR